MDLERGLLEMIDEYVSDAMAATGTRRAPRAMSRDAARELMPEPEPEPNPDAADGFSDEEPTVMAGAIVIDERNADEALLTQVAQQLTLGQSAIEPLPRARAPRATADLEDEVTNIVSRPTPKPL